MITEEYLQEIQAFLDLFGNTNLLDWGPIILLGHFVDLPWVSRLFQLTLELETEPETLPFNPVRITPARLLLEAGIALTPAIGPGDFRAGFALVRYGWFFRDCAPGWLLLPEECQNIESRHKAVMSEDLGVGITCFLMREAFGFNHIVDVSSALAAGFVERVNNGEQPDFCSLDRQSRLAFIESKGTQTNRTAMRRQANRGKDQLDNVRPVRLAASNTNHAISTFFATAPSSPQSARSTVNCIDPGEEQRSITAPDDADMLVRCSYAKVCRYAQNDAFADSLLNNENWNIDLEKIEKREENYLPIGFDPFGSIIVLKKNLFQILSSNAGRNLHQDLKETRLTEERQTQSYLPNGVGLVKRHNYEFRR